MYFSSHGSGRRRGVAILLYSSLQFCLHSEVKDKEGRFVLVSGYIFGVNVSMLNIYAILHFLRKSLKLSAILTAFCQIGSIKIHHHMPRLQGPVGFLSKRLRTWVSLTHGDIYTQEIGITHSIQTHNPHIPGLIIIIYFSS